MTIPKITINTKTEKIKNKMQKKFMKKILWLGSQMACPSVGGGVPPFAAWVYLRPFRHYLQRKSRIYHDNKKRAKTPRKTR